MIIAAFTRGGGSRRETKYAVCCSKKAVGKVLIAHFKCGGNSIHQIFERYIALSVLTLFFLACSSGLRVVRLLSVLRETMLSAARAVKGPKVDDDDYEGDKQLRRGNAVGAMRG